MSLLLAWGLLLLFAAGFGASILGDGWARLAGVIAMLAAAAGVLWTGLGWAGALWVLGPAFAILAQGPRSGRPRLKFDPLVRRAAVIGLLAVVASLAAIRIPIGDLVPQLAAVLWNLAALGVSWTLMADDDWEFASGATLAIAGGGALLVTASNAGSVTALVCGGLATFPTLTLIKRSLGWVATGFAVAAGVAVLALLYARPSNASVADLAVSWRPELLLVLAVILVGAVAWQPGHRGLAVIPAGLMLVAPSPALRWAGLAAALTLLAEPEQRDRRFSWAALTVLASSVVLAAALDPAPRLRLILAALVGGWLLLVVGLRTTALQVAIATGFVMTALPFLPADAGGRFQLLAAITAAFLFATIPSDPRASRRRLSAGLTLVGLSTLTPTGTLAAVLLVLDGFVFETIASARGAGPWERMRTLARSGWPPAVGFAGRTLAVLAALAANTLLGVVALGLLLAVMLTPLLEQPPAHAPPAPRGRALAMTVISLAAGLWPGWVARLGHL